MSYTVTGVEYYVPTKKLVNGNSGGKSINAGSGVRIKGEIRPGYETLLTPEALDFVSDLVRTFRPRVKYVLSCRKADQARYDAGELPGFAPQSEAIRKGEWKCAPCPKAIEDRRVEITGPVDKKMVINALNSGAKMFMADFEDSLAPTWTNLIDGQINLRDAVKGDISFEDRVRNKVYKLVENPAVLFVRPRGWHLEEYHLEVDGEPATGCLVDFGLYMFHNAETFIRKHGGAGPFFYLPKMEHSREAALWNAVFERAQAKLGIPQGCIKATCLIETLPAVFQMHEILYELRNHSAGLNCGRWDYIFSFIKTVKAHSDRLLPDRNQVGMTQHFLRSYTELLIKTCHKRGVHAMGGMAAQIPVKDNPAANELAFRKVKEDKLREVLAGHDGTWAAHPGLVPLVLEVFDEHMKTPNQLHRAREEVNVTAEDLLRMPVGTKTLEGLKLNTRVGIQYVAAWLGGRGAVPLNNLMEDAATAEISRVQNWQWIRYGAILDGEILPMKVTTELFQRVLKDEVDLLRKSIGEENFVRGHFVEAAKMFARQCTADILGDFLTVEAYKDVVRYFPEITSNL